MNNEDVMMSSIVDSNVTPMETEEGIVRLVVSIANYYNPIILSNSCTKKINAQAMLCFHTE